ncbi:hypothetical protein PHLCEN_2v11484 [Hermanssonia centrifuga]|uniref:Uncharacterized protein n=1 Tax=Hermanssonia centrifuga TaxID=98765 RepID=A0A2R6NJV1_9APHY|nr:hypothetical protein PHLCEN_2v11484 [Hermanssonia centrifuga]
MASISTIISDQGVGLTKPEASGSQQALNAKPDLPYLTMQIVVRRDLLEVLHETRDLPETIAYLQDLKNMRKVYDIIHSKPVLIPLN